MPENQWKQHEQKETTGEVEDLDFTKPSFVFEPNQYHTWRQQGPYVVCQSCEIEHASYIGIDKVMVGLSEDGTPILKAR